MKGKNKFILVFSIIFIVIYFFAAPRPLKNDLFFKPIWTVSVKPEAEPVQMSNEQKNEKNNVENLTEKFAGKSFLPFLLGDTFGYFTNEGEILRSSKFKNRISVSSMLWAEYSGTADTSRLYSAQGKYLSKIERSGFIHIEGGRIYLFEIGGCSVCEYSSSGSLLWRYSHAAAITAFRSSGKAVIIGYSDGKIVCISEGEELFGFYPGGSLRQVIMGAAVSEDGKTAVCVCGAERQRVIVLKINGNQYKTVHHQYLSKDLRRQVFVDFDKSGRYAVFETAQGIGILDCRNMKISFINETKSIIDIGFMPGKNIITILTREDRQCSLLLVEPPFFKVAETDFYADNVFLLQRNEKVFLGMDSKLCGIEIRGIE